LKPPRDLPKSFDCQNRKSLIGSNGCGRAVGDILIDEGLAVPFRCNATSCPKRHARGVDNQQRRRKWAPSSITQHQP
jgi:hypothetical protein